MFGSAAGFVGSEAGSALSNFVAEHSGARSVVLLDEVLKLMLNWVLLISNECVSLTIAIVKLGRHIYSFLYIPL